MTAQIPDILIHRAQRLSLCSTPLEDYFEALGRRRRPRFFRASTACWRGYIATWEIRDGKLYLNELDGELERGRKNVKLVPADLKTVLPQFEPPIMATWVNDELRCPEGRLRSYVHCGFASEYERDRLFLVQQGVLVEEWLRLNPPEPIWYRANDDGSRTRYDNRFQGSVALDDPFAPDEVPTGHIFWGRPEPKETNDDEGYLLGGWFKFPRPD